MEVLEKAFAVALTIPDNEAFTALETLRRLGFVLGGVRRADIWSFEVDAPAAAALADTIATIETLFNPNKHEIAERPGARPQAGEVWIAPLDEAAAASVGRRSIPGVHAVRRRVAWQLFDETGSIVEPLVLERAVETFLCNPAFQKAIR
jgi:phosphoribosylformylglycinamidine (FGAM) synthase PurS component